MRGGSIHVGGNDGKLTDWTRDGLQPADVRSDEDRQRARATGYDAGWTNAWEVIAGGCDVDIPWPERLRIIKRLAGASEVYFGDAGRTILVHLPERVSDHDQRAEFLPVPQEATDA